MLFNVGVADARPTIKHHLDKSSCLRRDRAIHVSTWASVNSTRIQQISCILSASRASSWVIFASIHWFQSLPNALLDKAAYNDRLDPLRAGRNVRYCCEDVRVVQACCRINRNQRWDSGVTVKRSTNPCKPSKHETLNQCWLNVGPAS